MTFMVTGGVFTDTTFTEVVPGTEESYGPFALYDDAWAAWRSSIWQNVDICEHRVFIRELINDRQ